jgi:hypothetical protein
MMQFHPLCPLALDNHPLPRGLVTKFREISLLTSLQKLRVSKEVVLVQRHRQCPYDVRLYTSSGNLQLDITNEKSACMAINVAGNNKTYIGNHVMCPEIL